MGRFVSADTLVSGFNNPQAINRLSYVTNNPLKYIDPTGHRRVYDDLIDDWVEWPDEEEEEEEEPSLPIGSHEWLIPEEPGRSEDDWKWDDPTASFFSRCRNCG
ncbi:hypothetical protein ACFLUY_03660 [Chloroflexota bacterium]